MRKITSVGLYAYTFLSAKDFLKKKGRFFVRSSYYSLNLIIKILYLPKLITLLAKRGGDPLHPPSCPTCGIVLSNINSLPFLFQLLEIVYFPWVARDGFSIPQHHRPQHHPLIAVPVFSGGSRSSCGSCPDITLTGQSEKDTLLCRGTRDPNQNCNKTNMASLFDHPWSPEHSPGLSLSSSLSIYHFNTGHLQLWKVVCSPFFEKIPSLWHGWVFKAKSIVAFESLTLLFRWAMLPVVLPLPVVEVLVPLLPSHHTSSHTHTYSSGSQTKPTTSAQVSGKFEQFLWITPRSEIELDKEILSLPQNSNI